MIGPLRPVLERGTWLTVGTKRDSGRTGTVWSYDNGQEGYIAGIPPTLLRHLSEPYSPSAPLKRASLTLLLDGYLPDNGYYQVRFFKRFCRHYHSRQTRNPVTMRVSAPLHCARPTLGDQVGMCGRATQRSRGFHSHDEGTVVSCRLRYQTSRHPVSGLLCLRTSNCPDS